MAGVAIRRHRLEPAVRASLVTGVAIHCRVGASQREAIVVLLYLANGNLPSEHGVALLAVCSQLAPVDVRMAILAAVSDAGKYRLDVTLGAPDGFMQSPQRIFRLVVVEFRDGSYRPPRIGGVAILAGDVEVPVRTVCASSDLSPDSTGSGNHQKKQRNYSGHSPRPLGLPPAVVLQKRPMKPKTK